jgi:hypothetical protein
VAEITSRRSTIAVRLSVWAGFGVIFGLLPLIVAALKTGMSHDGFRLTAILGHGELFIAGAVIAGGAIGELVAAAFARDYSGTATAFKVVAILIGCWTALALVANAIAYMVDADPQTIRDTSLWLFPVAVVPSGVTIAMVAT